MRRFFDFETRFPWWRIWVFYLAIVVVFGFFAVRLFSVQIVDGKSYLEQADKNRSAVTYTQTQRGIIYDRNGFVLARNVPSYNVTITPALLPSDEGATQEIYRQLSKLIDIPVNQGDINDEEVVKAFKPCENDLGISQIVYIADTNAPFDPVRIKCNVDKQTAMILSEKGKDWPGVQVEIEAVRDFPTGGLTSEVIGFLGPIPAATEKQYRDLGFLPGRDKVGYAGIESWLNDDVLMGKNGQRTVEVDVAGKELRDLAPPMNPVPGNNIRLTIDTRLQTAAREALISEMNFWNTHLNKIIATNGVVIAMNPKTGEILAMVSYPGYENNRMARIIPSYYYKQLMHDSDHPLLNHAISAEYPPGSVFKMGTAIGALNEGVVTPEQQLKDPGKITILQKFSPNDPGRDRDYVCWERTGHGLVDFLHGVAWSCDVYFYKLGGGYKDEVPQGLGIWRMGEYARSLGYGQRSGIELPGESEGLIPDPNWKRVTQGENWSTGDTYINTIGQGYVLATPLQVLGSIATLANDGKHMKPTLVKDILDPDGKIIKPFQPTQLWDITKDPKIAVYDQNNFPTGEKKVVAPWTIDLAKQGMRMVTQTGGTAATAFTDMTIPSAGKTGTAEYCDDIARKLDICKPENWPAHAWYVGYAPYDNPEIAVVAFVYNGREGATLAAPIVRKVLDAYFELKAIDTNKSAGTGGS